MRSTKAKALAMALVMFLAAAIAASPAYGAESADQGYSENTEENHGEVKDYSYRETFEHRIANERAGEIPELARLQDEIIDGLLAEGLISARDGYLLNIDEVRSAKSSADPEQECLAIIRRKRAEIDKLSSRIRALPDDAGLPQQGEIESIRKSYDAMGGAMQVRVDGMEKLEAAEERLANPTFYDRLRASGIDFGQDPTVAYVLLGALGVWYCLFVVQSLLAYGTAYRKAKSRGDNGVSLFGWMLAYNIAALVPFLGVFLWGKSRGSREG